MIQAKHIFPFLVPTLVLALILAVVLLIVPKSELHLALCQPHTAFLDKVVPLFTNLVDWLPYLTVVLLLFYRIGWGIFLGSNLLLSTLIVQPIKHIVHAPRPITWFAENMPDVTLPLVEGVRMNHWLSFPSGHTTTFFVLFFTLSIILCAENIKGKNILSFFCFLCAIFGAYTRIYLSQHFALDIFGGILIATLSTLIIYFSFVKIAKNPRFWGKKVEK
ncbi:MAG: phosphatase PAP2 family protein [Bacteroidales bacterium]|jgi:membrane-associated phospholipid phosphatase|nr:phosphatase PAP2 family protein [Bacteroidales bacterium]